MLMKKIFLSEGVAHGEGQAQQVVGLQASLPGLRSGIWCMLLAKHFAQSQFRHLYVLTSMMGSLRNTL